MPKPSKPASTSSPLVVESTEVRPTTRRRVFTAKEKLRIVRAAEKCTVRGELGALLRQEGIYHSMLVKWREQLAESGEKGLGAKRGPKDSEGPGARELQQIRRQLERAQAECGRLRELLELQKKYWRSWTPRRSW